MRKFIIRSSFVAIPVILFLSVLEWQLRQIPNDYSYKRAHLDKYANQTEVLILGSSLSWSGLDPSLFSDRCYNAAFQGQSLHYDKLIFEKYKNDWKQLRDVVLTVFYPTMEYRMHEVAEVREANYSIHFDAFPPRLLFPNYNGVQILQMLRKYWNDPQAFIASDSLGFGLKDRVTPEAKAEQASRLAVQHTRQNPSHRKYNTKRLKQLAKLIKDLGIDLWIVVHPALPNYRKNISKEQLAYLKKSCREVSETNSRVHLVDYFDSPRFNPDMFNDGIHLNRKGANLLSHLADSLIQSH